jgi:hypothetical protein
MTAIAIRVPTHLVPAVQSDNSELKSVLLFCGLGLSVSLLLMLCGMDLSDAGI